MTGFNHYSDCACGWCVNYGRPRIDREQLISGMRQRDALALLKQNSANSIAGCYVNPNARCPVCSGPVFFYANQFGSRVYFDDLGPPWPKHPCTDNPREAIQFQVAPTGAPTRRAKGITQELIAAANTVGRLHSKVLGTRTPKEWTLLVVASVERRGEENLVKAEFLDSQRNETTEFNCFSVEPIFETGDFVNRRGNEISFLYKPTLTAITFLGGALIYLPQQQSAPLTPAPPRSVSSLKAHGPSRLIPRNTKVNISRLEITNSERVHFYSNEVNIADCIAQLEPIVKSYARAQTRKPRDVALKLNEDGHKTACGARWTERLAQLLLALIFSDAKAHPKDKARRFSVAQKTPVNRVIEVRDTSFPETGPLTQEDIAMRLSVLGRVVVKGR